MSILSGPKGTRDFYPAEMAFRERIFDSWHRTCRRYGFELFDAPMFEHLELYTRKSGEEIEKQLYTFVDKGGRTMALRPELTPSLARMVASQGPSLKKPIRWYSIPRLFRYERMQRGRLREFFQLNMDILGVEEVTADAELIAASVAMMQDLGFDSSDFSVLISSRSLLEEYLLAAGTPSEQLAGVYALLDRKGKMDAGQFEADLAELLADSQLTTQVMRILDAKSLDQLAAVNDSLSSLRDLQELFALLESYGMADYAEFDLSIVRGLAYYTGIVFELFDKRRSLRAVAGGGRYDRLVESYGGQPTPAVGFAAGDVVLGELLKEKFGVPDTPPRCLAFVAGFDDSYPQEVISLAQRLRTAGIAAEYPLKRAAIGRQLKQANAARAPYVVFVGGDEGKKGKVKVKRMASGDEKIVTVDECVNMLTRQGA
ncbi:MAG: histidine--tRNA ligase [Chitinivibrionales bacterium]|nr:histidine--tRNA ligase [Chitinivibrionales bacterium]